MYSNSYQQTWDYYENLLWRQQVSESPVGGGRNFTDAFSLLAMKLKRRMSKPSVYLTSVSSITSSLSPSIITWGSNGKVKTVIGQPPKSAGTSEENNGAFRSKFLQFPTHLSTRTA
ncbi:hypothetical protein L798_05786 [Zootermopsis nevadensis]|uniref:Uncharacterized protein n=1 Tax=Zootermopsis nevadensis TaxID=136037 RepID=A0A067QEU7_ZOONE|nr:hypothetical protein L798_05786 [Zootermopsis nevadensis]